MARMKRVDVPDDYKPDAQPVTAAAESEPVAAAVEPPVPTGYVARTIVFPSRFWIVFDRQAARGGLTLSKYLERLLQHLARE